MGGGTVHKGVGVVWCGERSLGGGSLRGWGLGGEIPVTLFLVARLPGTMAFCLSFCVSLRLRRAIWNHAVRLLPKGWFFHRETADGLGG